MAQSDTPEHLRVLAVNVRAARERAGLSQSALSVKSGVDLSFLNEIENGKRDPSTLTLLRLGRALSTRPSVFLDGID